MKDKILQLLNHHRDIAIEQRNQSANSFVKTQDPEMKDCWNTYDHLLNILNTIIKEIE